MNYALVGYGIFGWHSASGSTQDTAANRVVALSRGSYACLSLINAFSTLVDCASIMAEMQAVRIRVDELLRSLASLHARGSRGGDRSSLLGEGFRGEEDACTSGLLLMTRVETPYSGPEWSDGSQPMLSVINLDLKIPGPLPRILVKSFNLALYKGMRLLVTGPSGCGKSTLLRVVVQLLRNNGGSSMAAAVSRHPLLRDEDIVVCPQSSYCFPVCMSYCLPLRGSI